MNQTQSYANLVFPKKTGKTHELKCWPEYFQAILEGRKTFEVRYDDRDYKVGDLLQLREWDPVTKVYSGRFIFTFVTYIYDSEFLDIEIGYVIMAIYQVVL